MSAQSLSFFHSGIGVLFMLLASISINARGKHPIDSTMVVIQDLCWSPGDDAIYFSAMKVKRDYSDYQPSLWTIYRYHLENELLDVLEKAALNVAISPDGNHLVFAQQKGEKRVLVMTDGEGNNPYVISAMGSKCFAPSWAPDGTALAFNSDSTGNVEIFIWHKDSGKILRLTESHGHHAYNPSWSPDGKHLAYFLEKGDGNDQIYVIDVANGQSNQLTNDAFNNIFPGWADSETLLYGQGDKEGTTKLFKVSRDGTKKRWFNQIETFFGRESNDRSKVAYVDQKNGQIIVESTKRKKLFTIKLQK